MGCPAPRRVGVLVLFAILAVSACSGAGERAGGSERPATVRECPPASSREPADGAVVTIFHETHTHGNLAGNRFLKDDPDHPRNVTFAQYVGLRNALRARLPEPANSLFLGNGDDISPTLNGVRTDGQHTIDAFNAAGVDANTFGFSETTRLDWPDASGGELVAVMRERVAASRFTWVSANVRAGDSPDEVFAFAQGARPWIIKEFAGVRVGITGLLGVTFSPGQPPPPEEEGVRVVDEVKAMKQALQQMHAAGAQIVVLLSHMIHEDTLRVVRSVEGIDVALGTHLPDETLQPDLQAEIVNGSIVAVAGPFDMQGLGQLDLTIRDGRIVDCAFRRHIPSATGPVDRKVEAVLARYLRGR
jgi:2',3'-cyclic-nucleotide 2'-phosphodiesterase (5'-nucleotidase family)